MADPTFEQQMIDWLKAIVSQRSDKPTQPNWVPKEIRLPVDVRGDYPIDHVSVALAGDYGCQTNVWGAIFVQATNGSKIGIKPLECEILSFRPNEKKRILEAEQAS